MYFGVWRRHPGAEIEEGLFDENTGVIGDYKIPIDFSKMGLEAGNSSADRYKLFKLLNFSATMLACVSITPDVYMNVYETFCEFQEISTKKVSGYPYPSIVKKHYVPIGYVQTYQKCLSVYQYPYYLLMDKDTGEIVGFPDVRLKDVTGVFPMSIFRVLADNPQYDAVWLDTSNNTHFLKKGEVT